MTGERLKELLSKCKVSQSEIARQLGLSHQSLNQMLSSSDIKTGLVERIAKVLNVRISFLYGEEGERNAIVSGNGSVDGNNNVVGNVTIGDDTSVLQQRIILLERLLEEKERTIKILMEK